MKRPKIDRTMKLETRSKSQWRGVQKATEEGPKNTSEGARRQLRHPQKEQWQQPGKAGSNHAKSGLGKTEA